MLSTNSLFTLYFKIIFSFEIRSTSTSRKRLVPILFYNFQKEEDIISPYSNQSKILYFRKISALKNKEVHQFIRRYMIYNIKNRKYAVILFKGVSLTKEL